MIDFPLENIYNERIDYFFNLLAEDFSELRNSFMMKSYVVHSLFCAITALKFGFPGSDELENELGFTANPNFDVNPSRVIPILLEMADAMKSGRRWPLCGLCNKLFIINNQATTTNHAHKRTD